MNNNRGNNNRRRGRGNSRPQGGGQQLNRIDSRARGNAPQLLEKYRKLAHDAHLNGDRVTAEYYLQFADHYFRVIADTRVRQDEQRQRRDDRWQDHGDEGEETSEFTVESDFPAFDQPSYTRREREDRPRDDRERDGRERDSRDRDGRERDGRDRDSRERGDRNERRRDNRNDEPAETAGNVASEEGAAQPSAYEPVENPFVRDNRGTRGLRPRREDRRPRRNAEDAAAPTDEGNVAGAQGPAFDVAILPPAIGAREPAPVEDAPVETAEAAPAPKRRGRKPKAATVEATDEV